MVAFVPCSMRMGMQSLKPVHHVQCRSWASHQFRAQATHLWLPKMIAPRARSLKSVSWPRVMQCSLRLARRFHWKTLWSNPRSAPLTSSSRVTFLVLLKRSKMLFSNLMLASKLTFALFTVALEQSPRTMSPWLPHQPPSSSASTLSQSHKPQSSLIKRVLKFASTPLFIKPSKRSKHRSRDFLSLNSKRLYSVTPKYVTSSSRARLEISQVAWYSMGSSVETPRLAPCAMA